MSTLHQTRLLELLQGKTPGVKHELSGVGKQGRNEVEEGATVDPVTSGSEEKPDCSPSPPSRDFSSPAILLDLSDSTTAVSRHTHSLAAAYTSFDSPVPASTFAHLQAMPRPSAPTGSWGSWGHLGRRPEFDSDRYGKPTQFKANKINSAWVDKGAASPDSKNLSLSLLGQRVDGGLGQGLVKPTPQPNFLPNLTPETQLSDIENIRSQGQKPGGPGKSHRESGYSTFTPPKTARVRTTTKTIEQHHAQKEPNDAFMNTSNLPSFASESPAVLKTSDLDITSIKTPDVPRLPEWGQGSSEAPSATTATPMTTSINVSEARAAPREKRPPISHYQRGGSTVTSSARKGHPSIPQDLNLDNLSLRDVQLIQGKARADLDRSNRKRRQDKHATANLELLHTLREPMAAKKENNIQNRIERYGRLGESPANWPVDPKNTEPGHASEAFAKSRLEFRLQQQLDAEGDKGTRNTMSKAKATQIIGDSNQDSGYFIPSHVKETQRKRNSRWVTADEIKAEPHSANSNEWGSANPDDATQSGDSVQAIQDGAIGRVPRNEPDPGLVGWDGNFIEPPENWERRPRMHPQKIISSFGDYGRFFDEVFHQAFPPISFAPIPREQLLDLSLHADGIGMVPRSLTVTPGNIVRRFGYSSELEREVGESLNSVTQEEFDREAPRPGLILEEIGYAETSEVYSQRFMAYIQKGEPKAGEQKPEPQPEPVIQSPEAPSKAPVVSIYLRPAALADLPQLTDIYNWHIEHGPRPAEMNAILESDMRARFDEAVDHKLPFIVAVEKVKSKAQRRGRNRNNGMRSSHPIQNTNPNYQAVVVEEKIVGWGYAADWSASDYVERISAEIEIYVEPQYRMKGVGRCLMDKMMQICDRGHFAQGGYDFHCLPEKNYMYSEGGARDLHKIWFIVRAWSKPIKTPKDEKAVKVSDRDDEFDLWLKTWLESWDFEQEGHLKQIGAKNGRFLDHIQLSRTTKWLPPDGEVPDPLPGTI